MRSSATSPVAMVKPPSARLRSESPAMETLGSARSATGWVRPAVDRTISCGDVAEHYVSAKSFKYFTKFLRLMKVSKKDIRLRAAPPPGYPGAWGSKRRWSGDEVSPFEHMRVLDPPPLQAVGQRLAQRLPERAPWLAEAGIAELWAGMIDVTPDAVPYICAAPAPAGLFIGTGLSGHGFGIGPGVGRILADLIQGRPPGHDISRFRFERFADGSPIVPGPY